MFLISNVNAFRLTGIEWDDPVEFPSRAVLDLQNLNEGHPFIVQGNDQLAHNAYQFTVARTYATDFSFEVFRKDEGVFKRIKCYNESSFFVGGWDFGTENTGEELPPGRELWCSIEFLGYHTYKNIIRLKINQRNLTDAMLDFDFSLRVPQSWDYDLSWQISDDLEQVDVSVLCNIEQVGAYYYTPYYDNVNDLMNFVNKSVVCSSQGRRIPGQATLFDNELSSSGGWILSEDNQATTNIGDVFISNTIIYHAPTELSGSEILFNPNNGVIKVEQLTNGQWDAENATWAEVENLRSVLAFDHTLENNVHNYCFAFLQDNTTFKVTVWDYSQGAENKSPHYRTFSIHNGVVCMLESGFCEVN